MTDEKTEYWSTRSCVLTGALGGQGKAEARLLAEQGAAIIAVDHLPEEHEDWQRFTDEVAPAVPVVKISADVADPKTWAVVRTGISSIGRPLAGLVNNAGITIRSTVCQTSLEDWQRVLQVNLTGSFLAIHHLAPVMQRGGSIVNISSTAGLTGYYAAGYTASKWALRGLAKTAAIELAPAGIRVNTVCPGLVDTPMAFTVPPGSTPEQVEGWYAGNKELTPLARGAKPEEIAQAVLYLLGPAASFITGADLAVDGGMTGAGIYSRVGRRSGVIPTSFAPDSIEGDTGDR